VRTQSVTLETVILSEMYYLTNLDIWLLAYEMDLPIILFSTNPFKNMVPGINWLVLSKTVDTVIDNKVHFISQLMLAEKPGYTDEEIYEYIFWSGANKILEDLANNVQNDNSES
jgi:hypothetical protein